MQYSGGHAAEGQGGFYGSGGARSSGRVVVAEHVDEGRSMMLALAADVQKITSTMSELETFENLLRSEESSSPGQVTNKSIELKASIKKLMTQSEFLESLNRLELEGEPIWGLSSEERELIMMAREKVNDS